MLVNTLSITVLNWSKYNSKSTRIRHPNWFSLSNRIRSSRSLFGLTPTQKWVWICLISECSVQNNELITIEVEWFANEVGASKKEVLQAIDLLVKKGLVTSSCQSTVTTLSDDCHKSASRVHNTTGQTGQTEQTIPDLRSERVSFDFEKIYGMYPRKEGKQKGIEKCKSQIKYQSDYEELTRAINRYRLYCEKQVTEPRFIKHFDTFMTSWRDYLDPDFGDTVVKVKSEYRGPSGIPPEVNKSHQEGDPEKIKKLMDMFRSKDLG